MASCTICRKSAATGNQVSHSQIHTKRKFKPNLQKVNGLVLCTKCLKTIKKIQREDMEAQMAVQAEATEAAENNEALEVVEDIVK